MTRKGSASKGIERAGDVAASAGGLLATVEPLTGTALASAGFAAKLGAKGLLWMRSRRARRAIRRIVTDPELTLDEYRLRFRAVPDPNSLKRQLLAMLRDIDDALDDGVVDPLIELFRLRASGRIDWTKARDISAMLRRMSAAELHDMQSMLADGLATTTEDPVVFVNKRKFSDTDTEGIAVIAAEYGELIPAREHADYAMRALRNAGLGTQAGVDVGESTRPGHGHGDDDKLMMRRSDIEALLGVIAR